MAEIGAVAPIPSARAGSPAVGAVLSAAGPVEPIGRHTDDRLRGIRDIRTHLARGMLTNSGFQVGLFGLTALRGFAVAAFVSRSDYGLWGLIGLTLWTALGLKSQFGAGEKYIQQSEANQEEAFQRAFTMEVIFAAATLPIAAALAVAVSFASGDSRVLLPGLLLLLLVPATVLQFPIATFYRRLEFRRQRTLQSVEPIVAAAVTIGLAIAGAGYWEVCDREPGRRLDPGSGRRTAFALPPVVALRAGEPPSVRRLLSPAARHGGGRAVHVLRHLSRRKCRDRRRRDRRLHPRRQPRAVHRPSGRHHHRDPLPGGVRRSGPGRAAVGDLREVKPSVVDMGGPVRSRSGALRPGSRALRSRHEVARGRPAARNHGAGHCIVHHVGYNWAAFVKARGTTWPIAVSGVAVTAAVVGSGIPLMYSYHLIGLGIGFAIGELVALLIRAFWLHRFFMGMAILPHLLRAFAPTAIAVVPVLVLRALSGPEPSPAAAGVVVLAYAALVVGATWRLERGLLREAIGYLLRTQPQAA